MVIVILVMGVICLVVDPLLMWLAARIVRVPELKLPRVLLTYGLLFPPLLVGGMVAVMLMPAKPVGAAIVCVGEFMLAVWLVKRMFRTNLWRAIGCLLLTGALNFVVAQGIRAVAIEAFVVPTGGMDPTIIGGDRILVDKVALRFRSPQRGEVVVFHPPHQLGVVYVDRVIGVEGDALTLAEDVIYVNGKPMGSCRMRDYWQSAGPIQLPVVVPPGKLFMLGDNRDRSLDSRHWGFADVRQVVGRVTMIYASATMPPFEDPLMRYSSGDAFKLTIHWERIGKIVR